MSTSPSSSVRVRAKLDGAIALKDYAISRGLEISDHILEVINAAQSDADNETFDAKVGSKLDGAIRDLTKVTYPTTVETVMLPRYRSRTDWLVSRYGLPLLAVIAIIIAIWSFGSSQPSKYTLSVLAASLGLLGALVFQLFNMIGVIEEKALNREDMYANNIRIVLGPIVGWIFYFGFSQNAFAQSSSPNFDTSQRATLLLLLVPFLAGFSTKLVVGVINQVIRAAELTLGIEDKRNDLLLRRRRSKQRANRNNISDS
jgi:hypothetical protein